MYQMRRKFHAILFFVFCSSNYLAAAESSVQPDNLLFPNLWNNWFVQFGGDFTLQNPYGYDFGESFCKGSSVGVDASIGKWFTPEIGLRARVNWENGLIDSKAEWLAPFDNPGRNHEKGGYLSIVGDIMFDIHDIVLGYDHARSWSTQVFLRAGEVYNFGVSKGSPLIGLGLGNTYSLSDRWGLYLDVAYNGVSSGFTGCVKSTGVGSGSNMYFDIDLGVQYNLGQVKSFVHERNSCADKSFWQNWFIQFGADMTLYTPYGRNLSDVFSKGRSSGLDFAVGKWFSNEIGARGSLNLENYLFESRNLEWIGFDDKYNSNYDGGGNIMAYFDVLLSAKHIMFGYLQDEKWDMYFFGRMGLGKNKAIDSLSPTVGAGLGTTYRFSKDWSIFADMSFKGITSEFFGGLSTTGMGVSSGFNGIMDLTIGVKFDLFSKNKQ